MIKICFVCTGNTCRSIMAERLAKKELKKLGNKNIKVSSRGLAANGENISENAKRVLKGMGASGANRKSVKLGKLDKNILYVTMTKTQADRLKGKVIAFSQLIGEDVLDPYGRGVEVYKTTAAQIERGVKILFNKILQMESGI